MKTIIFLHGLGATSEDNWFAWLEQEFSGQIKAVIPNLPHPDKPLRQEWVDAIEASLPKDISNCYLVGHSLGGVAAIYFLAQWTGKPFAGVLMVASPMSDLGWDNLKQFFDLDIKKLDFVAIQKKSQSFRLLYSDDDPYVPLTHGAFYQMHLKAPLAIAERQGHLNQAQEPLVKEELQKLITTAT
ncbi:alpha/beta fold hydrolase [Patescibacteria group bacterium]|nr:alpha/beta fold hydrolase [Patescibacteria group bacterium]